MRSLQEIYKTNRLDLKRNQELVEFCECFRPTHFFFCCLNIFSEGVKIRILRAIILPLLCVLGKSRSESNGKE